MSAEFLILAARGGRAPALAALDATVAARSQLGGAVHVHARRPGRFHLTVGAPAADVFFDGLAVFDDKGVQGAADLPQTPASGRGNYVLARRRGGGIEIEADPFGSYPVFLFERDGVFGVSNNLFMLADAANAAGVPIAKSSTFYGFLVTIGNGTLGLTGYGDIRLLTPDARIRLADDDSVRIEGGGGGGLIYSDRPYGELLDEAAHEISMNVRALAALPWRTRICDLSGGMDSRLVAAALIHEGLAGEFLFHTHGLYPDPDANAASLIRQEFGLPYINDVYVLEAGGTRWEKFLANTSRAFAMLSMYYGVGVNAASKDILQIGGGYGETFRGFYGAKFGKAVETRPLEGFLASFATRAKYLSTAERRHCLQLLEAYGDDLVGRQGVRLEDANDYNHLANRVRYHAGTKWRASNVARALFHPLYSPAATRAAYRLPGPAREANQVGYDLMMRLCPRLTEVPFANRGWDPALGVPGVPPATKASPRLGRADEVPLHVAHLAPPKTGPKSGPKSGGGRKDAGTRPAKWEMLEGMLESFSRQATPQGFARLEPTFDTGRVRGFLKRPADAFTTQNEVWRAYRMMIAYVWANDLV